MADIQTQKDIERLLFETGAISVAPENKPFWYTSGTIGPYYSNTQNLIGGEAEANALLGFIDKGLRADKYMLPSMIMRRVANAYKENACYHKVAEYIKICINENVDIAEFDYISGGERRDWFFSYIAALLFHKPHITIYKDLSMVASIPFEGFGDTGDTGDAWGAGDAAAIPVEGGAYAGKRCLHVSDIITEASSYARSWFPAVAKAGMKICTSLTILDRMQGGGAVLDSLGIRHLSLARLDAPFFIRALENGHINKRQHMLLHAYVANPNSAMRGFLIKNPEFLRDALRNGGKEAERARMCIESGVYGAAAAIAAKAATTATAATAAAADVATADATTATAATADAAADTAFYKSKGPM